MEKRFDEMIASLTTDQTRDITAVLTSPKSEWEGMIQKMPSETLDIFYDLLIADEKRRGQKCLSN